MSNIIEVKQLSKYYNNVKALNRVSFNIAEGTVTAITGKSGCGKTTLLNMIGGLDDPSEGDVKVMGRNISDMKEKELSKFRAENIGFVFQFFDLVPEFSAEENILLPQVLSHGKIDEEYFSRLTETLGIKDFLKRLPSELSGGEQQRVAIARAIIRKPKLVLMDEPTGNLDEKNTEIVRRLIHELRDKLGMTVVYVTHDRHMAEAADTIITMRDGVML